MLPSRDLETSDFDFARIIPYLCTLGAYTSVANECGTAPETCVACCHMGVYMTPRYKCYPVDLPLIDLPPPF